MKKVGLKLKIQKMKIMASGPITSWEIDGETVEIVSGFIFLGSKVTAVGDCSHEIKRCLLLGRKAMSNLDSILKSRGITFFDKGPSSQIYSFSRCYFYEISQGNESTLLEIPTTVKAMFFSVVMYECESWTIKKAEHRRIDAFEL